MPIFQSDARRYVFDSFTNTFIDEKEMYRRIEWAKPEYIKCKDFRDILNPPLSLIPKIVPKSKEVESGEEKC